MNKEQFKELFLNLTEYTVPFGTEPTLEKYLPSGYKKDSVGNYYYEIGQSKTLFTAHLDTFSNKRVKVNHIIDDKDPFIIKTDGKSILGGDNKLGCSILISMIRDRVPGTYYFFLGEEPILSGGLWGSSKALESNPEFFKNFDRCIAFDRKGYGSVVIRQMGRMCCSNEFSQAIASHFDTKGVKWDSTSSYGYYTDTAVFMDVISECTNISAGGFNEHYNTEWVDLNYTYNVYQIAKQLDWETLPKVRENEDRFHNDNSGKLDDKKSKHLQNNNISKISKVFKLLGLSATRNTYRDGVRHITFSKWLEDVDFDIYLKGSKILLDNEREVTFDQLTNEIMLFFKEDIIDELHYYIDLYNKKVKDSDKKLLSIMKTFGYKSLNVMLDDLS